jgi:hypothetical protein
LATSAGKALGGTAGSAVLLIFVVWARAGSSRALLCDVAFAGTCAADGICGSILAARTAAVVGIITDSVVLKLASSSVTAGVIAATFSTATVTIFACLHDTVTALAASDGHNTLVVRETR